MKQSNAKPLKENKVLNLDEDTYQIALRAAQERGMSVENLIASAVKNEISGELLTPESRSRMAPDADEVSIFQLAEMKRLSVCTIRNRVRKKGDPLRIARVKTGKLRPMRFSLSRLAQLEAKLAASA